MKNVSEMQEILKKLEDLYNYWCDREDNAVHGGVGALDARGRTRGIKDCIDIIEAQINLGA